MVRDAEANAAADRKRKADVETKNNADQLAFQCEKFVKESGDKIDSSVKSELESQIQKVREQVNSSDFAGMKTEADRLQTIMQNAASQLYQKTAQQQGSQPQEAQPSGGDAVDADYEVVK